MEADPKLSRAAVSQIDEFQRNSSVFISIMSVWEVAHLLSKRRVLLRCDAESWFAQAFEDFGVKLIELTLPIALDANRLPEGIHADPVDRILIATARVMHMTLLTRDRQLLDYAKQGHVRARKI